MSGRIWFEPHTNTIYFDGDTPSNFQQAPITLVCPVRHTEEEWADNEHYFQACKIAYSSACDPGIDEVRAIQETLYAGEAKRLGRAVPLLPDEVTEWNRWAPVHMLECNIAKYTQNPDCREWLLSTETATLVEHRKDSIWGDNLDGTGKNLLGKILELVRVIVAVPGR